MSVTHYRTVARSAVAQIDVSRSRFRCRVERVQDEADVRTLLDSCRAEGWGARHHCSAFVLGPEGDLTGSNDAGEPSGTAGRPILEALQAAGLSDTAAVVSRWFGGTLLGTGGLVRAYGAATRAALDAAGVSDRVLQEIGEIDVDLVQAGRLEHALRARGVRVLGVEYSTGFDSEAGLRVAVPPQAWAVLQEAVAELTAGQADVRRISREWVDVSYG